MLPGLVGVEGRAYVLNASRGTLSLMDFGQRAFYEDALYVGQDPTALAIGGEVIMVTLGAEDVLKLIALDDGRTLAVVPTGARSYPVDIALGDTETAYVTTFVSNELISVNLSIPMVTRRIPVGSAPVVLVVAREKLYVINSGERPDAEIESIDAGMGSVTVIDRYSNDVVATVELGIGSRPWDAALDPEGELNVVLAGDGTLLVIDTQFDDVVHVVPLGGSPRRIAVDAHGLAYIAGDPEGLFIYDTISERILHDARDPVYGLGVADDIAVDQRGFLYLTFGRHDEEHGALMVVEPRRSKIVDLWWTLPGIGPLAVE